MLVWAVRMVVLWGGVGGACLYAWNNRADFLASAAPGTTHQAVAAKPVQVANTLSFKTDRTGHVYLEAAVNGSPVRFLVDTGASFVTLRPEDARAAGFGSGDLHFTQRSATANGQMRVAPVKLRELRLGQLTMEDVDAVVVESQLNI